MKWPDALLINNLAGENVIEAVLDRLTCDPPERKVLETGLELARRWLAAVVFRALAAFIASLGIAAAFRKAAHEGTGIKNVVLGVDVGVVLISLACAGLLYSAGRGALEGSACKTALLPNNSALVWNAMGLGGLLGLSLAGLPVDSLAVLVDIVLGLAAFIILLAFVRLLFLRLLAAHSPVRKIDALSFTLFWLPQLWLSMIFCRIVRLPRERHWGFECGDPLCGLTLEDPRVECLQCAKGRPPGLFQGWPTLSNPLFAVCPVCGYPHPLWRTLASARTEGRLSVHPKACHHKTCLKGAAKSLPELRILLLAMDQSTAPEAVFQFHKWSGSRAKVTSPGEAKEGDRLSTWREEAQKVGWHPPLPVCSFSWSLSLTGVGRIEVKAVLVADDHHRVWQGNYDLIALLLDCENLQTALRRKRGQVAFLTNRLVGFDLDPEGETADALLKPRSFLARLFAPPWSEPIRPHHARGAPPLIVISKQAGSKADKGLGDVQRISNAKDFKSVLVNIVSSQKKPK